MSSNLLFEFFYWNSLIQKDVWDMMSNELELHVAAKLLTNFKHLKGFSTFLLILDKKQLTYKISKERRTTTASAVGVDNLISNLWIILLRLIATLISKYKSAKSSSTIYTDQFSNRSSLVIIFSGKEHF